MRTAFFIFEKSSYTYNLVIFFQHIVSKNKWYEEKGSDFMDTSGFHLIIDAYECDSAILNDKKKLKEMMISAIDHLGMEILLTKFHSFSPQGVTGVIGISTSHFSIHTWPEHGYAAFDLYTCGNQNIWPPIEKILHKIKAKRVTLYDLSRGNEAGHRPVMKKLSLDANASYEETKKPIKLFELRNDRGNDWDMKQLKEILSGKHDVLYHGSSPYQDILLVQANDLRLYLNQELQFCSLDERHYHEALVFPVMEAAASHKRILILGGGDGLALREVLKYPNVRHVDLVDIDAMMIQLSKTEPALLKQNNRSFLDERVQVHIEDAKNYLSKEHKKYNVIIIDFPDPVDAVISSLYTKELFRNVANHLAEDGALVCQSNSSEDAPVTYWSIGKTIEEAGLKTIPYNVTVPSFGLWGFHLAAHQNLPDKLPGISVPHHALQTNMEQLFKISDDIISQQTNAVINSIDELTLHKVYQGEIEKWF